MNRVGLIVILAAALVVGTGRWSAAMRSSQSGGGGIDVCVSCRARRPAGFSAMPSGPDWRSDLTERPNAAMRAAWPAQSR